MPWYFIPRVLTLAECKNVCLEWLRWGFGNCESIGKAHCVKTLNCHGNTLVQQRTATAYRYFLLLLFLLQHYWVAKALVESP